MIRRRWLRAGVAAVGLIFVLATLRRSWDPSLLTLPGPIPTLFAIVALAGGVLAAALGWVAILEVKAGRAVQVAAFLESQLAKHIPGGVWQVVAQYHLSVDGGVERRHVLGRIPVHLLAQLLGGAMWCGAYGFLAGGRWRVLVAVASGVLLILVRSRHFGQLMKDAIGLLDKEAPSTLPTASAMLKGVGLSATTLLGYGVAYSVLLRSIHPGIDVVAATAAFGLAWTVGYLAIPFPGGLGVREAALIWATAAPATLVLEAALLQRVLAILVEAGSVPVSRAVALLRTR